MSDQEVAWTAITDVYDFRFTDDYDAKLLNYVKSGMLDPEAIREAAGRQDTEFAKQQAKQKSKTRLIHFTPRSPITQTKFPRAFGAHSRRTSNL